MTSSTSPIPRRLPARLAAFVVLALFAVLLAPAAQSGGDDFEFGKRLAENRLFDYARKVYEGVLSDPNATDESKGEAKYGMALLKKEEAMAAAGRAGVTMDEIVALFDSAVKDIAEFVQKNPKNVNARQARLDVGTIRLAFVQWARELLDDPNEMHDRNFDPRSVGNEARDAVREAIEYFGGLRPRESDPDPKPEQLLANYYYVICQYYSALVEAPCSAEAKAALKKAGSLLEEYIMINDGQLLAVYAQDIYGLVFWELAKCAQNDEEKADYYSKAFEWFETCIYTEDFGEDFLRVITSGYYHLAQVGLDAGRMPQKNFARDALIYLEKMLDAHPTAWRTDNGLKAMIEWSKLECSRGNSNRAVEVAKDAGERAKAAGKDYLERVANRQLTTYISGGCGGSVGGLDPSVLLRVADDLYGRGQHEQSIRAYRTVIQSAPDTAQGFVAYRWHAWERIAKAYRSLGDRLGEALAYQSIHEAWMDRRIARTPAAGDDDPNLIRAGDQRRAAEKAMKEVAEMTGSRVLHDQFKAISSKFSTEYPDHPTSHAGDWNTARERWSQARAEKSANKVTWKTTLADARRYFRKVSVDMKSPRQSQAWTYLVRCDLMEDKYDAAIATGREAFTYWETPELVKQAEDLPTVAARREDAKAQLTYWIADAQMQLEQYDAVLKTLATFHRDYPQAGQFESLVWGHLSIANLKAGNIDEADRYYRTLLKKNPGFSRLNVITFGLAGHYNDQRAAIEEELRGVTEKLNEARRELNASTKQSYQLSSLVNSLTSRKRQFEEALRIEAETPPGEPVKVEAELLMAAHADKNKEGAEDPEDKEESVGEKIAKLTPQLDEWVKRRDEAQPIVDGLLAQQKDLKQRIYTPLVSAAGYYKAWDDALKAVDADRDPSNIQVFGQLYWFAGRLRPEETDNWRNARRFYREYLDFPKIQALPVAHPDKRKAIAHLGDILVNLAEKEPDADKRLVLVRDAVDLLQNALAKRAVDNELVVGMLENKVLVLNWRDSRNQRWRFAIPRPASVAELRTSVKSLGKEGGPPLPRFDNDQEEREYLRALSFFIRDLGGRDDGELRPLVKVGGAFDPHLYRSLANSDAEFRLALAWAYAETGRDADVPKAVNLAKSLIGGPMAVEEDSEDWWRARTIQLLTYVNMGDRKLGEGTAAAQATRWLDRAGQVFQGVAASFPDLGEGVLDGNRAHWMQILTRLNSLRSNTELPPVQIDLSARGPEEGSGDE